MRVPKYEFLSWVKIIICATLLLLLPGLTLGATINVSVSPTSLDFGSVTIGEPSDLVLTITNQPTSTATLGVSPAITSSCGCFFVVGGAGPFGLPPGNSRPVTIRFFPTTSGIFSGTFTIISNATSINSTPTNTLNVPLSGTGIDAINLSLGPVPVSFGNVPTGLSTTQTLIIRNLSTSTNIAIGSIADLSAPFSIISGGGAFSLAPGQSRIVIISFSPTSLGTFSQNLSITHAATNINNTATPPNPFEVEINGTGIAPAINISVRPDSIDFGNVVVGQFAIQTLLITNLSTSTGLLEGNVESFLGVFSVVSGGGSFSLAPNQSKTIGIRFSPMSLGTFSETLSITHNATNQSSPISVTLMGTGSLIVNLSLSSSSLGFGNIPVGQSIRQVLTITNEITSVGPLTGTIGSPSGPFSVVSGDGAFNLPPGRSQSVVISFSPPSAGLFLGTLPITHNATNQSSPINVLLSGATPINWGIRGDIPVPGDYDGDGRADISVWRPSNGSWFLLPSSSPTPFFQPWGILGDDPVPDDYDGDARTDLAVWRSSIGTWFIQNSSGGPRIENFGNPSDIPVPGDYDGDGKADLAIWRPTEGNWFIPFSSGQLRITPWGLLGDIPVPGDYDGDGKADLAIWRPGDGVWFISFASGAFSVTLWGLPGDIPVPADYNGDGKVDLAVWRPAEGNWYILFSGGGFRVTRWGLSGDIPVPADYNGDGKVDLAVWRPAEGNWYIFF